LLVSGDTLVNMYFCAAAMYFCTCFAASSVSSVSIRVGWSEPDAGGGALFRLAHRMENIPRTQYAFQSGFHATQSDTQTCSMIDCVHNRRAKTWTRPLRISTRKYDHVQYIAN
jgi:hypothetical protein